MEINAIIWYFGCTKTEANKILNEISKETLNEIIHGFTDNAKRSFYED